MRKILLWLITICAVAFGINFFMNNVGIPKSKLEADIRTSQYVADDWLMVGDVSDKMAAFVSYPEDKSDSTYSFYVNRPGISFGYFFRSGGDLVGFGQYIPELMVDGYDERAFISMNELKVERLEINDGNSVQVIEIDSEKPFAIILSVNAGELTFYDINGNIVEFRRCYH